MGGGGGVIAQMRIIPRLFFILFAGLIAERVILHTA